MGFKEQLNEFYRNLDNRAEQLNAVLGRNGFRVEKKFLNGHYNRDAWGNYVLDYFPIPVIEVQGLCDIEINATHINVSTRTSLQNAYHFNYDRLASYYYEVYGVNDYLSDYYRSGEPYARLYKNLEVSREREIGFGFSFVNDMSMDKIVNLILILHNCGFYYQN